MMDEKTKKAMKAIIASSEASAAEAFAAFRDAVNDNPIDRDRIDRLYKEWKTFDDYFSTHSTMLEMLNDGIGFDDE